MWTESHFQSDLRFNKVPAIIASAETIYTLEIAQNKRDEIHNM